MALSPGTSLGHYNVTSLLGEGGMGQVWQATDTQLNRQVEVLPEAFAADPDRLARFTREARILASLNHPNIAQIHGIEEAEGTRALVLELVEGPTLADRISKGPIPLDEALREYQCRSSNRSDPETRCWATSLTPPPGIMGRPRPPCHWGVTCAHSSDDRDSRRWSRCRSWSFSQTVL